MSTIHPVIQSEPRWAPELFRALGEAQDQATAVSLLLSRRIPVFPCVPGGKRPLTPHGFKDASTNVADVAAWWTRWPDANIAIPTGARSGVDVVDVDVHPAGSGFAAFEHASQADLVTGWSWLVRTPSGGVHAYFPVDAGREQRSWQMPTQHIDFRGDGGYIIVPPSAVADADGVGGVYRTIAVAESHEPKPVDAGALRSFLAPTRPITRPQGRPPVGTSPERLARWVASIAEGGRNAGLYWAANRMREEGHDADATAALLVPAASNAGLDERESWRTIQSAYRAAPRSVPHAPSAPVRQLHAVEGLGL